MGGCPTVLIGGMPAARVGDQATCVGPSDTITTGEPTVLIGGKPAARLGDTTAHGGVIVTGCETVLIGSSNNGGRIVPVVGNTAHDTIDATAEVIDDLPF